MVVWVITELGRINRQSSGVDTGIGEPPHFDPQYMRQSQKSNLTYKFDKSMLISKWNYNISKLAVMNSIVAQSCSSSQLQCENVIDPTFSVFWWTSQPPSHSRFTATNTTTTKRAAWVTIASHSIATNTASYFLLPWNAQHLTRNYQLSSQRCRLPRESLPTQS